jgi:hypothetical protein
VTAPFTDYNQSCDVIKGFSGPQDWTGKTLHVRVKVASGGSPAGVSMQLAAEALSSLYDVDAGTNVYFFSARYVPVIGNDWQEYTFSGSTATTPPSGFDATKVIQFGVQLVTADPGPGVAAKPTTAVVYIDTFTLVGEQ